MSVNWSDLTSDANIKCPFPVGRGFFSYAFLNHWLAAFNSFSSFSASRVMPDVTNQAIPNENRPLAYVMPLSEVNAITIPARVYTRMVIRDTRPLTRRTLG